MSALKRICILTRQLPPRNTEGIPRTRWQYALDYRRLGFEVHIVTSGENASDVALTSQQREGIWVHEIAPDHPQFSHTLAQRGFCETSQQVLGYARRVADALKILHAQYSFDLIESPLWYLEGFLARDLNPPVPVVVRLETTTLKVHEIVTRGKLPIDVRELVELEKLFLARADGLLFDSWSILNETVRQYGLSLEGRSYAVVPHGLDLQGLDTKGLPKLPDDRVSRTGAQARDKLKVIVAGRLERRKGTDIICTQVLPELVKAGLPLEMHFCGKDHSAHDGFQRETGGSYKEYVQKRYPELAVHFHGYVPDEELERRYRESHVALCLSRYESFGLLYLEAMRTGLPVVAYDVGATPEIFENDVNGFLLPYESATEVAALLTRLFEDESLAARVGRSGYQNLRKHFDSLQCARRCGQYFEELIDLKSNLG